MSNSLKVIRIEAYGEWNSYFNKCGGKSLPQAWEYGSAKKEAEGWLPQRYIVRNENNTTIAIFQVLVKKIPFLGGVARINKGPLMIDDDLSRNNYELSICSIKAITYKLKKEKIWLLQLAPFLPPNNYIDNSLKKIGFNKRPNPPADSALVSLSGSDDDLMMRFNSKWRNLLRKGLKLGVNVKFDSQDSQFFDLLVKHYERQQKEKGFKGTSNEMLYALKSNQSEHFKFNLLVAFASDKKDAESVLGVLVVIQCHDVSEYLIGITTEKGRKMQANSVLLWNALLEVKKNGALWFDVGGLNETTPKGIATFKKGMNPKFYALTGEWRKWFLRLR